MGTLKRLLAGWGTAALLAVAVAGPAPTLARAAGAEGLGAPLDLSQVRPSLEEVAKPYIDPSRDGQLQLKMVGDRFAAVFTPEGQPIVVFDLSLHNLKWKEILLGGIGFGDLTLGNLIKSIRHIKKQPKKSNDIDQGGEAAEVAFDVEGSDPEIDAATDRAVEQDARFAGMSAAQKKDLKRGMKLMGDVRLSDDWAERNRVRHDGRGEGVPFQLGSFRLDDIQLGTPERKKELFAPLVDLARILYPDEEWNETTVQDFAREFEFRFDAKRPGYDVYWNPTARGAKRKPKLPGIVANFVAPWNNLVYKHQLRQFDQYGEALVQKLGVPGMLMDLVLSRVVHNLSERLDYHERQFLALLEANARFEYDTGLPLPLVDAMTDLVYLSRYVGSGDPNLTDGPAKRKVERALQESARVKTLAALEKLGRKKHLEMKEVAGGKFALALRREGDQSTKMRGIYGLGLSPTKFLKRPSLHVNANGPALKIAERYSTEVVSFLVRAVFPGYFGFRVWKSFYVSIRIPPALVQNWIRGRAIYEAEFEGELKGLLQEAAEGRYSLPLSPEETKYALKQLNQTYINPYELSLGDEKGVIEKNLALLKQILAGNTKGLFTEKGMVPYTM